MFRRFIGIGCLAGAMALAGCASVSGVTSDVSSYSSWPSGRSPGSYVFERLPSQVQQAGQDDLEQAARAALTKAGFTEAKSDNAEYNVQLGSRVGQNGAGSGTGIGIGGGFGSGGRSSFSGVGIGLSFGGGRSFQERDLSIVIRDRKTAQTLFESTAHNDGSASQDARTTEAMFAAALTDFPNSAVNPRRIVIDPQ
ncbi:hypothetical protein BH09PSE5_BH09PSE5_08530 [soil metagenome]